MNDLPRQKLCELIQQHGTELCNDPKRCKGMLRDICGEYKREINALMSALDEQVALDLLIVRRGVDPKLLLRQLAQRLQEHLNLTPDEANWAVESWALALGVIEGIVKDAPKLDSLFNITQSSTLTQTDTSPVSEMTDNPSGGVKQLETLTTQLKNSPVPIYEFRRGFTYKPQGRRGDWVSKGFYGPKYVGITFPDGQVPSAIETAIKAQAFDVYQLVDIERFQQEYDEYNPIGSQEFNERYVDNITVVGRTVGLWEVLAVITWAIDFAARPLPVQRYFCCQRSRDYDAMATLICWWTETRLKFDICENEPQNIHEARAFPRREMSNVQDIKVMNTAYNKLYLVHEGLESSVFERDYLLRIWKTCRNLAKDNGQKRAWAVNTASLIKPGLFTLIQCSSRELLYSLSSVQNNSDPIGISLDNETSLKQILENFMSQGHLSYQEFSLVKQEIRTQNDSESWQGLFESIDLRFHEEIEIIRFLVFQALIIPEKVVDLFQRLIWFDDKNSWRIFHESQQSLTYLKPEIDLSSREGVWLVINQIVERKYKVKLLKKLGYENFNPGGLESKFFSTNGIWREALKVSLREMLETYENDTSTYENDTSLKSSYENMQLFLDSIQQPLYRRKNKNGYYHLLAILENLSKNKEFRFLQALISNEVKEKVSDDLYRKLKNQNSVNYPKFLKTLNKELTLEEKLEIVGKIYIIFQFVLVANIVFFGVASILYIILHHFIGNSKIIYLNLALKQILPHIVQILWISGGILIACIVLGWVYYLIWLIRHWLS